MLFRSKLFLEDAGKMKKIWNEYLQGALHVLRTLLCVRINETPHSRLFAFDRKTPSFKTSLTVPGWLTTPKRVLFNNINADPPSTQEVKLVSSNKDIAHVKLSNGKDITVKVEDLYPILNGNEEYSHNQDLIELDTAQESVVDVDDSDSDIVCLDENAPRHPTVKIDPNSPNLSSF
mgnify:CR=1 FL=1